MPWFLIVFILCIEFNRRRIELKLLQQPITFFSPGCIILIFFYLFSGCTTSPRYTKHSPSIGAKSSPQPKKVFTNPQATSQIPQQKQGKQSPGQFTDSIEADSSETDSNQPIISEPVFSEDGLATYYSDQLQGHKTSFGERYDKRKYTAAHKTLPFNTMVKVTSIDDGKSVIVRINDRGPHGKNRIIDLSKAAANEIDLVRKGLAKVKIEVFEYPQDSETIEQSIP